MDLGIVVPQGWTGEYAGWDARVAWERTVAVARAAERLGFTAAWTYDHFHTAPEPRDELTFESFSVLAGLATLTSRVRLGQVVLCAAFRNPALTAKMAGTLDVIAGGRMEVGIGAGWKEDEWRAYGYGFPDTPTRLGILHDHLEVLARMLAPGRATWDGRHASVTDAINEPRGLQEPRIPIMVGGNGRNVTWRLAARYADELNLNWMAPDEVREAKPVIERRCEEVGRDPASLSLSVNLHRPTVAAGGQQLVDLLGGLQAQGVRRIMAFIAGAAASDDAIEAFVEDARAAGVAVEPTAA
jgi:F420-dependent oxidoreductase-like protein